MRRGDGENHTRRADLDPTDAMRDRDANNLGPLYGNLRADLSKDTLRHGPVRLVFEIAHRLAVHRVAGGSREHRDGPRGGIRNPRRDRVERQRLLSYQIVGVHHVMKFHRQQSAGQSARTTRRQPAG